MKNKEEDTPYHSRREVLALIGASTGVFAFDYADDYVTFAVDPERFIEPDHPKVEEVADRHDYLTGEVDLGIDWEYRADAENFKPAGQVLETGAPGDCEDLAFIAASILENKDRDWKMVAKPGHTEVQYDTEWGVYEWSTGAPENPSPRSDNDWTAMYDLDNGWSRYDQNWHK